MGYLKKFFRNVFRDGAAQVEGASSFEQLSEEELEAHLSVDRYGDFVLTNAIRPSFDLKVTPKQGYRHDSYHDEEADVDVPVLMASVSKERLLDVFMDLLDPLGEEVDVVLETSHHSAGHGHVDHYREHIDMPVLKSTLWDFEELLLNDGCTGLAVLNPHARQELQFDEHKLLIVYGEPLEEYEKVLRSHGLLRDEQMQFITEAEHVHSSSEQMSREVDQLRCRLGIDGMFD